jgi:hypothetical protein
MKFNSEHAYKYTEDLSFPALPKRRRESGKSLYYDSFKHKELDVDIQEFKFSTFPNVLMARFFLFISHNNADSYVSLL